MESNATALHALSLHKTSSFSPPGSDANAYLYILIVMCFYGVFLTGIMISYVRTKRREKQRSCLFRRLLYEEEGRCEWGASPALSLSLGSGRLACGPLEHRVLAPLACALCSVEQSSVSSLCSSADVHFTIKEEPDSGAGEGLEDVCKSSDGSAVDRHFLLMSSAL